MLLLLKINFQTVQKRVTWKEKPSLALAILSKDRHLWLTVFNEYLQKIKIHAYASLQIYIFKIFLTQN